LDFGYDLLDSFGEFGVVGGCRFAVRELIVFRREIGS
jgi:hypothetical protein